MTSAPTGTVTFLFTDIEGSTRLAREFPAELPAALARHHTILQDAIAVHHGHVFQIIGDAFCVAFATAPDALAAAIEAQRALQAEAWSETPIKVRMGLHTGAATLRPDGDYEGYLTLAQVQRVMSVAYGGQTLVSNASAGLLAGQLPEGVSLRDMGEQRLKSLLNLEHLWQVVAPGLPADFPPLQSLNTIPNNLPLQVTSFVGREKEIAEVKRLLSTTRLLTLTGSGGTGKTRLSLQVAADVLDPSAGSGQAYHDGVWFVELAPLADPAFVAQTVATALGVREQPGRPMLTTLSEYLHDKQLLLILDNCEHLIETCARLADTLQRAAPKLALLASSREALGIAGETAYRVPSLSLPDPMHLPALDSLTQYESVKLFVERATQALTTFSVTYANAPAVAQICYRLDGIPLAIELAASRVKVLSAEQIAARLDDRFRLLTGGSRTALPRQQTLRGAIDWSYSLLSEPERVLLRRLSVFAGGWTLEAAEHVCAGKGVESFEVLDLLTHLVDKSLVATVEQQGESRYPTGGPLRCRMLETVRQYAREKLLDAGEGPLAHDRHLDYYLAFARTAEPELEGRQINVWLDRLEVEIDNLRAGLNWASETGRAESGMLLATALFWLWNLRGYQAEGLAWLQRLLQQPGTRQHSLERGNALHRLASTFLRRGDVAAAVPVIDELAEVSQTVQDPRLAATLAAMRAFAAATQGNLELAISWYERSLALWKALGDRWRISTITMSMGMVALQQEAYPRAEELFAEGVRLQAGIDDANWISATARYWGYALLYQGRESDAAAKFRESLSMNRDLGDRQAMAACLTAFAALANVRNDYGRAAGLLGAGETVCQSIHMPLGQFDKRFNVRILRAARAALDPAAFDAAFAAGRALTLEQAVALALEEPHA